MMIKKRVCPLYLAVIFAFVFCIGQPLISYAQLSGFGLPAPTETVTAKAVLSVNQVQPGSQFQIAVVMSFKPGWHANANPAGNENLIPTEVILPTDSTDFTFNEVVYPEGDVLEIASIGKAPVYHDEVAIGIQATLSENAQPRQVNLPIQLLYQACSDETCLLPKTITVDLPLGIVGNDQPIQLINDEIFASLQFGTVSNETPPTTGEGGKFTQALSRGYFWAFLFVFVGGILTSLTPCVYPLIPITVSVFGASESTGRLKSFLLSVTYVCGIAVMYSILGIAVASTGAVFGQIMANPWVIGFVSAVLIALGLSMLGVFELRLPYAVQNKLNTIGGAGFGGAFAMGTVAGIIAAPCTGPALGAVLTFVATTGSTFLGFWLLLTYALGMGLLFIVIGTFSSALSSLPRSGGWMYILENIFGIVIIAMALYFLKEVVEPLRSFLSNSTGFFVIAGVLLIVGLLLSKLTQRFSGLPRGVKFRKAFGVFAAVLGLYMIVGGFTTVESKLDWAHDEATGLAMAKEKGKPVMLDFYATWCGACVELDKYTFSHPEVASELSGFVTVKLDFSRISEKEEALKRKYGIVGLPVVLFLDSDGKEVKRIEKFVEPEEFLKILAEVKKG